MAAGIETAMIAIKPSWWGDATVATAQTAAEAIKLAGLDWNVIQEPVYRNAEDGLFDEVPNYQLNVRDSDNSVLAVVGKNYTPIQNVEWFSLMDSFIPEGVKFETAGSLWKGKQVWMMCQMPESLVVAGDELYQFIMATNFHDGKGAGKMITSNIRGVCWNTVTLALASAPRVWSIRHNQSLSGRRDEVMAHLQLANKYAVAYKEEAERLLKIKFAEKKYPGLVEFLLPFPEEATTRIQTSIENRRALLWQEINKEDLANIKNTGWGMVQAVAGLVAHEPPGRKTATWTERRFSNIMIEGDKLVKKALEYVNA